MRLRATTSASTTAKAVGTVITGGMAAAAIRWTSTVGSWPTARSPVRLNRPVRLSRRNRSVPRRRSLRNQTVPVRKAVSVDPAPAVLRTAVPTADLRAAPGEARRAVRTDVRRGIE